MKADLIYGQHDGLTVYVWTCCEVYRVWNAAPVPLLTIENRQLSVHDAWHYLAPRQTVVMNIITYAALLFLLKCRRPHWSEDHPYVLTWISTLLLMCVFLCNSVCCMCTWCDWVINQWSQTSSIPQKRIKRTHYVNKNLPKQKDMVLMCVCVCVHHPRGGMNIGWCFPYVVWMTITSLF